jgi:hypothetical protein
MKTNNSIIKDFVAIQIEIKRVLFVFFVLVASYTAQSQSTCLTAIALPNHTDSLAVPVQQTDTVNWYYFVAQSAKLEIDLYSYLSGANSNFTSMILWGGNCSSLFQITSDIVDSINDEDLVIEYDSLTVGITYYLQVNKINVNQPLYFFVSYNIFENTAVSGNCEYVQNPYFEYSTAIVTNQNQLNLAAPWIRAHLGTSDYFNDNYFNAFIVGPGYDVPTNISGTQQSMPSIPSADRAYAGFAGHFRAGTVDRHEYVQQKLVSPLTAGVTYRISFFINLGDNSPYACNKIGMYLSINRPYTMNAVRLRQTMGGPFVNPQIHSQQMPALVNGNVTDQDGWTRITGDFVGGGEEWITIGNFTDAVPWTIGGVSYYLLDNVSITPTDFTILPQPIAVCPGVPVTLNTNPSQLVKWSSNTASFSCGTCATTNLNSLSIGTHLIDALVILTNIPSCTVSASASILVSNTPPIQVTANPSIILAGNTSILTAFSPGAISFAWTPANGLSNVTSSTTTFNLPITSTYNVTSNLGNGCTGIGSVTIDVIQPFCDKELVIDYAIRGNSASAIFGTNVISNKNIAVSGTLLIDMDIKFETCNFIMEDGASIVIQFGSGFTLEFTDKTHLFSCGQMWDGIYVSSEFEKVIIRGNSLIEDAINAVVSDNGGTYEIQGAIFNRNLNGVVVNNSILSNSPGFVRASVFTSRFITSFPNPAQNIDIPTLLPQLGQLTSFPLKKPFDSPIAAFGIHAENNVYLEVGNYSNRADRNYFDNLGCGIFAEKTNIDIWNNRFQNMVSSNITNNTCANCPLLTSTAIKVIGDYPNAGNAINIGGYHAIDGTNTKTNTFIEVYQSIDITGYDYVYVAKNIFKNSQNINLWNDNGVGKFAVYVTEPPGTNFIKIVGNEITNNYSGIVVYRSGAKSNNNSKVQIFDNTIKELNGTLAVAIALCDVSRANTGELDLIQANTIVDADLGIYACNVAGLSVNNNSIGVRYTTVFPNTMKGIYLESCEDIDVIDNCDIYCTTPAVYNLPNANVKGIYVYNSKGSRIISNRISNTSQALTFELDCSDNTALNRGTVVESNHFHDSRYGLYMLNNGKIGTQGNLASTTGPAKVTENMWFGANFTAHTFVDVSSTNVNGHSKFYVRDDGGGASTQTLPLNNQSNSPSTLFYTVGTQLANGFEIIPGTTVNDVNNSYQCNVARMALRNSANITVDSSNIMHAIEVLQQNLQDSIGLYGYEHETVWQTQKYVMDKLNFDNAIINSSDSLHDFYTINSNTNIGLLSAAQSNFTGVLCSGGNFK